MTSYKTREMGPRLGDAIRSMPVVVVSGMRQTGKTTMLAKDDIFKGREYFTLDDFTTIAAARQAPNRLLEDHRAITIDEVQRCPDLLIAIKADVDRDRKIGKFVLSGSSNLTLLAQVTESLAGRAIYMTLHPMTRREITGKIRRDAWLLRFLKDRRPPPVLGTPLNDEEILTGGMPSVVLGNPRTIATWFTGFVQNYVERDVRQIAQITDLISFRTFAHLVAMHTGQILNVSSIARDADLPTATATRYLHILETSFLVHRLPPFLKNRSSRLIKAPKIYMTDSGLAAHMAGLSAKQSLLGDPLAGALLETYTLQNIIAILDAHVPSARVYYWHEQSRHEVDLVIEFEGSVFAIEIKSSARFSESDTKSLRAFMERTPKCVAGVVAYNGRTAAPVGENIWAVPLGQLIS